MQHAPSVSVCEDAHRFASVLARVTRYAVEEASPQEPAPAMTEQPSQAAESAAAVHTAHEDPLTTPAVPAEQNAAGSPAQFSDAVPTPLLPLAAKALPGADGAWEWQDYPQVRARIAQAKAEERRAMAVALEQEMKAKAQEARAKVIEAEAEIPMAIAESFRSGNLGIMDYYKLKNVQADTEMRESIAKPNQPGQSKK